ncbi:MAG: hypothetical protein RI949_3190 [Pseudomonadota bacterium]
MRRFADLYQALDATTSTSAKVEIMVSYFTQSSPGDAAWSVYFLSGGKVRRAVATSTLRTLACEVAGLDDWLFEECYQVVGDLAETIALVVPGDGDASDRGLAQWVEEHLWPLRDLDAAAQMAQIRAAWHQLDAQGRFLYVKLLGGGLRVGVSKLLVQRALAQVAGVDASRIAQRMMGWAESRALPSAQRYLKLIASAPGVGSDRDSGSPADDNPGDDAGQPYPFFLAHPWDGGVNALPPLDHWQVEWKYDGIRAQVVRRAGQIWIWSRGEELITERFPEVESALSPLPDGTVLDGELLAWREGHQTPLPFQRLQQRLSRKVVTRKVLSEVPVVFLAYDLLEWQGQDVRTQTQSERRQHLEQVAQQTGLRLSALIDSKDWQGLTALRSSARARGVEGLMLKHRASTYGVGRRKPEGLCAMAWWKWKVDPYTVDAVLIYAQAGHGRRASLYTDYTFAVWNRPPCDEGEAQRVIEAIVRREPAQPGALQLVPFAKAYSGLSQAEIDRVDKVIRAHTLEKFGPVRSVKPTLVLELGFEGLSLSPRHKSGIAVRFPRILRIRDDKPLHEADALPALKALLAGMTDST